MKLRTVLIIILSVLLLIAAGCAVWIIRERNTDHSGWVQEDGIYYLDFHGEPVTRWQEIDGQTYYFLPDGQLATGWQSIDGAQFYFGENGIALTGWQTIDGKRHYFSREGIQQTGWQDLDGARMYLDPWEGVLTGWQQLDGKRVYLGSDGALVSGTVEVDGFLLTFREDGTLVDGWHEGRHYREGVLSTGWQQIGDKRYRLDDNGDPVTGWLEEEGNLYYLFDDGSAAIGPNEIDGKTYYFSPKGVHVWLVNPWNFIHEDYTVDLVASEGGFRVSTECIDELNAMLEDCRAAGLYPMLISGYRSYWDQVAMYNAKIAEYGKEYGSKVVAVPNTSEHQLGLAVDIILAGPLGQKLNKSQGETAVQKWLMEHCWDYGFILRYPEEATDITGIIYEPWHYRYVGLEIAQEMKELGITLEEYLGAVQ